MNRKNLNILLLLLVSISSFAQSDLQREIKESVINQFPEICEKSLNSINSDNNWDITQKVGELIGFWDVQEDIEFSYSNPCESFITEDKINEIAEELSLLSTKGKKKSYNNETWRKLNITYVVPKEIRMLWPKGTKLRLNFVISVNDQNSDSVEIKHWASFKSYL